MATDPQIVIIISAGRSGSKYLRDLLGASRDCVVVPYDINYVWRYGNERQAHDVLEPSSLGPRNRSWIRRQVLRLANWPNAGARIVVEKSVPNSLRVPFVLSVFPEARFIHLVRDGRAVAESSRRVWNERPSAGYYLRKLRYFPIGNAGYALRQAGNLFRQGDRQRSARIWGPHYPGVREDLTKMPLLEVCGRQWLECVRRASADLAGVPSDRVITVRFEDLVAECGVLESVAKFSGIDDMAPVLSAWKERSDRSNVDKWRQSLTPDEAQLLSSLMREELTSYDYPDAS